MSEFHARIARVRLRDGPSVSILPTPLDHGDPEQPENWRGKLIHHAKEIAGLDQPGSYLDGFIVIGLFSDGATSTGCRLPQRLPRPLIPAYVADVLRRDLVTARESARVFDEKFQWVEG